MRNEPRKRLGLHSPGGQAKPRTMSSHLRDLENSGVGKGPCLAACGHFLPDAISGVPVGCYQEMDICSLMSCFRPSKRTKVGYRDT